mmetsp:Transcript_13120/g.47857  ORF Transcript_13120/g.47857 Transcript_13120/m.47857 type:complete len:583 (+) Transcript_13120:176-1924(+)
MLSLLRKREQGSFRPGTSVNRCRQFYPFIVPNQTVLNVTCPDCTIKKFTCDGKYLIAFAKTVYQELCVYQLNGFGVTKPELLNEPVVENAVSFDQFFSLKYMLSLGAEDGEVLCKDFVLVTADGSMGIFASATVPENSPQDTPGTIPGLPVASSTSFHLVRLEDGVTLDRRSFTHDLINVSQNHGTYLYEDLFVVLSIRYQEIHIMQILPRGRFVDIHTIGTHCRPDDLMFIQELEHREQLWRKEQKDARKRDQRVQLFGRPSKRQAVIATESSLTGGSSRAADAPDAAQSDEQADAGRADSKHMLSGFKQRLIEFMYRRIMEDDQEDKLPGSCRMREKQRVALSDFYYNFSLHENLFFWRLQLLDRDHLLIKMGTADSTLLHSDSSQHVAFLVVYCISTTEIVDIFSNSDERLLKLYEKHSTYWLLSPGGPSWMRYVSTFSSKYLQDQVNRARRGGGRGEQRPQAIAIRRVLSMLPASAQSYTPSPYFDASLFSYDEKAISALTCERPKQSGENAVKFFSAKHPRRVLFRIDGDKNKQVVDTRSRRLVSYIFHPYLPLIISIHQPFMQAPVIHFHFRWCPQ